MRLHRLRAEAEDARDFRVAFSFRDPSADVLLAGGEGRDGVGGFRDDEGKPRRKGNRFEKRSGRGWVCRA